MRGRIVALRRGSLLHPRDQTVDHRLVAALQEAHRVVDVARIAGGADQPDARRAATPDLMLQAWSAAVGVEGVAAIAQPEQLLQEVERITDRAGARVRPEVAAGLAPVAAVEREAREGMRGDLQVRVRLVVAQQDVVARVVLLDQVELEQQGLGLGVHHRDLDPHHLRHQRHGLGRAAAALAQLGPEVRRDPPSEVARLADVEDVAGAVEHPVDARAGRQVGDEALAIEGRGLWRLVGHRHLTCSR